MRNISDALKIIESMRPATVKVPPTIAQICEQEIKINIEFSTRRLMGYHCDEVIKWFPVINIPHRDGTQVVPEPNG